MTHQVGPLLVNSSCAPDGIVPGAFALGCGGMLSNASTHPVQIVAEVMPVAGVALSGTVPAPVEQTLSAGASLTLADPSPGQWIVTYLSKRSLEEIGLATLGGVTLLLGLAGVGVVDIVRHFGKRRKRRR